MATEGDDPLAISELPANSKNDIIKICCEPYYTRQNRANGLLELPILPLTELFFGGATWDS